MSARSPPLGTERVYPRVCGGRGGGCRECEFVAAAKIPTRRRAARPPIHLRHARLRQSLPVALACLIAWLPNCLLPQVGVAALVPGLITRLSSSSNASCDAASTTLAELLARPPVAWGPGVLLEPLMAWVAGPFAEYASPSSVGANAEYALPTIRADALEPLKIHARLLLAGAESGTSSTSALSPQTPPRRKVTLVRVMLALTAADPGGAPLRASTTQSTPFANEGSTHAASGDGFASTTNGNGNGVQDADADSDDEYADSEKDGIPPGGPLAFWFALQEALWEVDVANAYLYPFSFPAFSSSSSFPTTPSPPSPPRLPQHPHGPSRHGPRRPRALRGPGGVGGTPRTPGANSGGVHGSGSARPGLTTGGGGGGERGSYAFASTLIPPPAFARQGSSGFGFSGTGGGAGGADRPFEADADVDAPKQERESGAEKARTAHARAAYVALVRILKGNIYYVLRDDLLTFLMADAAAGLEVGRAWEPASPIYSHPQTIGAPLHWLRAVHEALDLVSTPITTSSSGTPSISGTQAALARLFGSEVW
ncbi:hypothetical protein C8F04DRAFT_1395947 [Mycena alexandri]|uniref:Uncharacterized protein n=1 Tax=Mycena alexandri TaxID=1745969 RepID=A0AAD6STB2_9AGAR|nr:hypothetical protein C8F04DRAFT_1395947 [Mycena alexandri]